MLKLILSILCLIAGLADCILPKSGLVCKSTQILPNGYPCYLPIDVEGWIKAIVINGCHAKASEKEIENFYKCLIRYCPNYIQVGVILARYPLQCGEKLLNNSPLPENSTDFEAVRLYCKSLSNSLLNICSKSKDFRLMSCAMHEYNRKLELRYADWRTFNCPKDFKNFEYIFEEGGTKQTMH